MSDRNGMEEGMEAVLERARTRALDAPSRILALPPCAGPGPAAEAAGDAGRAVLVYLHLLGSRRGRFPEPFFARLEKAARKALPEGPSLDAALGALARHDIACVDETCMSHPGVRGLPLGSDDLALVCHAGWLAAAELRLRQSAALGAARGGAGLLEQARASVGGLAAEGFDRAASEVEEGLRTPGGAGLPFHVYEAARMRLSCGEGDPLPLLAAASGFSGQLPDGAREWVESALAGHAPAEAGMAAGHVAADAPRP